MRFRGLVLVADVPDQFLEDVFDGHQAGCPAVLVGDNGDVNFLKAEILQQIAQRLGFRDENLRGA